MLPCYERVRVQEKAQLLEAQVSDLNAQLQAAKERNAVLQHRISSPATPLPHSEAVDDPQTVTELHTRCQVRVLGRSDVDGADDSGTAQTVHSDATRSIDNVSGAVVAPGRAARGVQAARQGRRRRACHRAAAALAPARRHVPRRQRAQPGAALAPARRHVPQVVQENEQLRAQVQQLEHQVSRMSRPA